MNFLQIITGSAVGYSPLMMEDGWVGISGFLLILLSILVMTTSLKSKKIKRLEAIIKELRKKE